MFWVSDQPQIWEIENWTNLSPKQYFAVPVSSHPGSLRVSHGSPSVGSYWPRASLSFGARAHLLIFCSDGRWHSWRAECHAKSLGHGRAADWPPCFLSCNPPVTLWTTEFLKVQILYILKFLLFPNTNFAILWPLLVQDSVTIFLTSPHFCSKESIEVVKQLRLQENRSVSSHLCPVRTTMPGRCTAGRRQLDC